ncbi:MAG: 50S ribosomal protein L13 [Thermoplasmata archaeon]
MDIIDAEGLIVGRLSSVVAKRLLDGGNVVIVNADKAIIIGRKDNIIQRYKAKYERGSIRKGPFFPRMPDRILRRTVRGMLPMKSSHGKMAYKNLMVYIGVPKEYADGKKIVIEEAKNEKVKGFITLKEISKQLGAKL